MESLATLFQNMLAVLKADAAKVIYPALAKLLNTIAPDPLNPLLQMQARLQFAADVMPFATQLKTDELAAVTDFLKSEAATLAAKVPAA